MAATTEPTRPVQAIPRPLEPAPDPGAAPRRGRPAGGRRAPLPDRVSLILFAFAGFMAVLAVLCVQLYGMHTRQAAAKPVVVLRKLYETRVVTTVVGGSGRPTVSQSVSAPPAPVISAPAPTTRAS